MLRFRIALMILLVGLTLLTVTAIGVTSYRNAKAAARELSDQVLDQISWRIHQEVQRLVGYATAECELAVRRMHPDRLDASRFPLLVDLWKDVMAVRPRLTSIFIGLEATGESVGVSRLNKERLSVWQSRKDPRSGGLVQEEYWISDYPSKTFATAPKAPDARTRPWYQQAREARRPVWTQTYQFLGTEGVSNVRGVTYAVPLIGEGGVFRGVLSVDFDLAAISRFLATVNLDRSDSAFIVEQGDGGDLQLIAHRSPAVAALASKKLLGADAPSDDAREARRIQACLAQLPPVPLSEMPTATTMRFMSDGAKCLGASRRIDGARSPQWMICVFMPESEVLGYADHTIRLTVVASVVVLALAVLLSIGLARQVARPLERMADDAIAAGSLRLESSPRIRSIVLEVDRLSSAAEEMKAGLRSFQKYMPVRLVRKLLESGQEAVLGGEKRTMTILFTDIVGFSSVAESVPVEDLVQQLGEYFAAISTTIADGGGTVDKYIGDAVMAFWGAPAPSETHAADACVAAVRCLEKLRELQAKWTTAGRPLFHTRFGLHTGEVIVGNIGSPNRMNYTVIGDPVNLSSRLEGLNRHYGTSIIASEQTILAAGGAVASRLLDVVAVAGRAEPVFAYEVLGLAEDAVANVGARYTEALSLHRSRRWSEAIDVLADLLEAHPDDGPSNHLLVRCRLHLENPPDDAWDGVHRMSGK